ncbi:MAG: oxygen-dependent coproporphyrinogen oxidase [Alphaproteobacteria bacterium]
MNMTIEDQKQQASDWFQTLRDQICAAFEAIEANYTGQTGTKAEAGKFEYTKWDRPGGGGGTIGKMTGRVFEKVGVNISAVSGEFSEAFRKEIPGAEEDPRFWASGISLVAHMQSPHVPPVHMNTRHIITTDWWFGGGADLNPIFEVEEDTLEFHTAFEEACDRADPGYYPKFKQWADEYFFIPHRNEPRGVGGIFYDRLNSNNWAADFAFTQNVGKAFLEVYPKIVRRRMNQPWTDEDRDAQLIKRGRYTEFNLLHDRGTRFGIMTDGNPDAILMSLPPLAKWE